MAAKVPVDTSVIGVDIGSTAVRAVRLSRMDGDFASVERFAVVPLAPDMVRSGKIRNVAAVGKAVKLAVRTVGGRGRPVVLGATATESAVGRLSVAAQIPAADRLRTIETLGMQVTPTIPVNEATMATDFIQVNTTGDDRQVAVLNVAVIPSAEFEVLSQVGEAAGVKIAAIDLAAAGTLRALVRDVDGSKDLATIVDVGATRTTVITREGLHLRSVRTLPTGGLDLTKALMASTKEDIATAERRKYQLRLPTATADTSLSSDTYGGLDPDADEDYLRRLANQTSAEQALGAAVDGLVDQIAQAIEADNENLGRLTHHLTLCGGTAMTKGLKERLQRRVGVPVRIGHPWAHLVANRHNKQFFLVTPGNKAGLNEDPRLLLSLVTAIGLALRPKRSQS